MKKSMTRFICLILSLSILSVCAVLSGCSRNTDTAQSTPDSQQPLTLSDCAILHEPEFGGVYITMTIDDFNDLGFSYGDSVSVVFSNGYKLDDIPYYNGYYTKTGEPLLVAYKGYDYIKAHINNSADLWEVAELSEGDTATVTLVERGKYLDIQNARDLHYTDERSDYESDEMFANFRAISAGIIKENTVYRSASPCDNQHNRAPYVDALIKEAGVNLIIDLADDDEKIQGYMEKDDFNSPYFAELYAGGKVCPLALNMDFSSEKFRGGVLKGLTAIAQNDGAYLIHCTEGKDRTGFVCMLIEALCGASYDEIVADYMITYYNYYHFDKETDPQKYDIIVSDVLDPMIGIVAGEDVDIKTADLSQSAEAYLADLGMDADTITLLKERLTA